MKKALKVLGTVLLVSKSREAVTKAQALILVAWIMVAFVAGYSYYSISTTCVFVGVGVALAAAYLAKITHAPRARILFESGIIDPIPINTPIGIADPRLSRECTKSCRLFYALGILQ